MPHFLAQKAKTNLSQECTLLRAINTPNQSDTVKNKSLATTSLASLANTQNLKIYPKLQSLKSQNLALIPIKFDKNIFFLQEVARSNDLLINGLKITRPTPVATLKTALEVISQDYEVISHNLNPHNLSLQNLRNSNPHNQNLQNANLHHPSPHTSHTSHHTSNHSLAFLLSPKELLERVFSAFKISLDSATPKSKPDKATTKTTTKSPANLPAKSPKIFLEIGFGSGRHILHLAKQNPNDIFIGLEVHTPSIEQVLKNIAISNLQNLFILHFDARVLLEILPSNSLDCIFLHFPVPWNDSPSRRVFSEHFLALALRVLKKGGILELKTDDEIYFKDALSISKNLQNLQPTPNKKKQSTPKIARKMTQKMTIESSIQTPQDFEKNDFANNGKTNPTATIEYNPKSSQKSNSKDSTQALSSQIISKYQARWLRQNKNIFTLKVQSLRKNRAILLKSHFLFDKNLVKSILTKQPKLSSLINHKQVFANGFLHISDIFASQKSKDFARLAFIVRMGDFAQPMSCVVVFEMYHKQVDSYYLKEPPLPTKATTEAHKRFIALLEKL
ncbi:tRNA (guanosine(46)-N7)-methyltransferase TrmB [Helicobacter sp. MIT 01-3238]|uniref:tRNA (guanosine(46)-N7)-methyltransferase TrmB n=1 Tax=Helicobacter sp. MIT 01-3238 TaxID=398627 RepID=UPI000E1EE4C1|nr:tRNA (guanosine(46)-N7)-methyltransferase TrmB [Helicobacter sp. MIT 01-3238]RDU52252.1 tRNA (guanosine(46)-N7)-methyltransferase TrmB [Helicobacter sp. MIT 01-3238]